MHFVEQGRNLLDLVDDDGARPRRQAPVRGGATVAAVSSVRRSESSRSNQARLGEALAEEGGLTDLAWAPQEGRVVVAEIERWGRLMADKRESTPDYLDYRTF